MRVLDGGSGYISAFVKIQNWHVSDFCISLSINSSVKEQKILNSSSEAQ